MIFEKITSEQVTAVHQLYAFLRKLKVIGIVKTSTEQVRITEMGRPIRYTLKYHGYDASMKGKLTAEEKLDRLMQMKIFFDNSTRQTE